MSQCDASDIGRDAEDAQRYRFIIKFLALKTETHERETLVQQNKNMKHYQIERDWYWCIEMNDESWQLGATVYEESAVPKTLGAAVDALMRKAT